MSDFKLLDQVVHPAYDDVLTIIKIDGDPCTLAGVVLTVCSSEYPPFNTRADVVTKTGCVRKACKYDLLKMYVVVDNEAPKGLASNGASHVSYFAGEDFVNLPSQKIWRAKSLRNVTCSGSSADIQTAIQLADAEGIKYVKFEEPDWVDAAGRPLAVAFAARFAFPAIFSTFPLFLKDVK